MKHHPTCFVSGFVNVLFFKSIHQHNYHVDVSCYFDMSDQTPLSLAMWISYNWLLFLHLVQVRQVGFSCPSPSFRSFDEACHHQVSHSFFSYGMSKDHRLSVQNFTHKHSVCIRSAKDPFIYGIFRMRSLASFLETIFSASSFFNIPALSIHASAPYDNGDHT